MPDVTLPEVMIERAVEWYDTDAAGHQHHSVILRWAEAADCFRKAIEITPDYGDAIEALEDVEMAIELSRAL